MVITGDHAVTARAIALKLGIVTDPSARVVEGKQLEAMTDEDLFRLAPNIRVYARVSPEHKQRIVRALQRHGETVAMTGDGINDAPALRLHPGATDPHFVWNQRTVAALASPAGSPRA